MSANYIKEEFEINDNYTMIKIMIQDNRFGTKEYTSFPCDVGSYCALTCAPLPGVGESPAPPSV